MRVRAGHRWAVAAIVAGWCAACGGSAPSDLGSVGGTITGLVGTGLVLQLNGGHDLAVPPGAETFEFRRIEAGSPFVVSILSQPSDPRQTCSIENPAGRVDGPGATEIRIRCSTQAQLVGGTVTGLLGSGLVVQVNGQQSLAIPGDGAFTFPDALSMGTAFTVTVAAQPTEPAQTCTVSRGIGTIGTADVTTVAVHCSANTYAVGGSVTGLVGSGLVLRLDGETEIAVARDGRFVFPAPVASGADYGVTVKTQPTSPWQTCTVAPESGTILDADANVAVSCTTNTYRVSVAVQGLIGSGFSVQLGAATPIPIPADGSHALGVLESGTAYDVRIAAPPASPAQSCDIAGGTGSISAADVAVTMSCTVIPTAVSTIAGTGPQAGGYVDGPGAIAEFRIPIGIVVDGSGNLYVGDQGNHCIRKISPAAVVSTFAGVCGREGQTSGYLDGDPATARFYGPTGVARDSAGNLYVADQFNNRIRKVSPAGVVSTLAGAGPGGFLDGAGNTARFAQPTGVAVDGAGNVYVADLMNNRIRKITPAGTVSTFAGSGTIGFLDGAATTARFNYPRGVAVDAAGVVYVADTFGHRIRRIASNGTVSTIAGDGQEGWADGAGTQARLSFPYGVAIGIGGDVWFGSAQGLLRKVSASGQVTTVAGSGACSCEDGVGRAASLCGLEGLTVDAAGNVFATDSSWNRIRKLWQ